MSQDNIIEEEADTSACCASCGTAEVDDIKLKDCDGCDLVKYCSDECMEDHKLQHKEECNKRAAELRDELLFKQPESTHLGDCPICSLPLPLDQTKTTIYTCCSKLICKGCDHANKIREIRMRHRPSCPFCREALPVTDEEENKLRTRRIEANDTDAICQEGTRHCRKGEYHSGFECFAKAAELGDVEAHHKLSAMYNVGLGVEQNEGKMMYHLEEAAIGGHPEARYDLGCYEWNNNNNVERAAKHWIISFTQGHDESIKWLMEAFKAGNVNKDELAAALRAHKAAVDATKSPQREEAEEFYRIFGD